MTGTKRETSGSSGSQSREFAQAGERFWGSQVVHHPGESPPGKAPSGEAGIVSTDVCPDLPKFDVGVFRGTGGLRDQVAFADLRIALRSRAVRSGGCGKPTIGRPRTWQAAADRAGGLAESGA